MSLDLYRQDELDNQMYKEAQADYMRLHNEQVEAIEKSMERDALHTICPTPDELEKRERTPEQAQKLLSSLMLLGMLWDERSKDD